MHVQITPCVYGVEKFSEKSLSLFYWKTKIILPHGFVRCSYVDNFQQEEQCISNI